MELKNVDKILYQIKLGHQINEIRQRTEEEKVGLLQWQVVNQISCDK